MNIIKLVENDRCYDFCADYTGENLNIDKINVCLKISK